MKTVNRYMYMNFFYPFIGAIEDDAYMAQHPYVDEIDHETASQLIQSEVVPDVRSLHPETVSAMKLAMRYILSTDIDEFDFEGAFNSLLPPFGPPADARDFFVWIWEDCFPGEDYMLPDYDEYVVKDDFSLAGMARRRNT